MSMLTATSALPRTLTLFLVLLSTLMLSACHLPPSANVSADTLPAFYSPMLPTPLPTPPTLLSNSTVSNNPIPPASEILALPIELRQWLDQHVAPLPTEDQQIRTLLTAFFSSEQFGIRYDYANTGNATDTWRNRKGNCLSISLLVVASARYVGLQARFQDVLINPEWNRMDTLFFVDRHVNVRLYSTQRSADYVVDLLPGPQAAEANMQPITDSTAFALYYNNRASELLLQGERTKAFAHFAEALHWDEKLAFVWANLGTLYHRNKQDLAAELVLRKALALHSSEYTALKQLATLYTAQGRAQDAQPLQRRVTRLQQRNPFHQAQLAYEAMQQQDTGSARTRIEHALRLKDDDAGLHRLATDIYERVLEHELAARHRAIAVQLETDQAEGQ
jgi:Tfp pilus assembly protein PilF